MDDEEAIHDEHKNSRAKDESSAGAVHLPSNQADVVDLQEGVDQANHLRQVS